MDNYIVFKIGSKKVGIKYTENFIFEPTLINKSFVDVDGLEYINYRRENIRVIDTSSRLFDEPMKKFDGLLFIIGENQKFALKTESFFKYNEAFDIELGLDQFLEKA